MEEKEKVTVEQQEQQEEAKIINMNPENAKQETIHDKVYRLLLDFCNVNQINIRNVIDTLINKLNKETKLMNDFNNNIKQDRARLLNIVEFKELRAREIIAQKTIDNHNGEMMEFKESLVNGVLRNLSLTAETEEQKEVASKVADMFGMKLSDINADIDRLLEERVNSKK